MEQKKLIHHEKFFRLNNIVPILLLIIVWGFYYWFGFESLLPTFVFVVITLIVFVLSSRRNSTYFIYEDRIELFNSFSNKLSEVINYEQIHQIRYEDEFDDSYGVFWSNFILIYPKKGVVFKNQKKDRIALTITGLRRQPEIIKLLKFFQSKKIDVVIKTNSERIHDETGLKNWDQAY